MNSVKEKITVVIPCRNEEKFIGQCLDALLSQTYPKEKLEIIVVDGASEDKTLEIVESYADKNPQIKILENQKRFTPISMNIGLRNATGNIITIIGAHSELTPNYLEKCEHYLKEYRADAVGGVLETKASRPTLTAKAIALALSHPFGTGGSPFRVGTKTVQEVDTVFNGCYQRSAFKKAGFYNEKLIRSQDMEFNLRLKRAGGKILLAPDIVSIYHPSSTLKEFFSHNLADGTWAILPLKFGAQLFRPRHLIPLLFLMSLLGTFTFGLFFPVLLFAFLAILLLYLLASLFFSFKIAVEKKQIILLPFLMSAFAVRHFGYGIGSLIGVVQLLL